MRRPRDVAPCRRSPATRDGMVFALVLPAVPGIGRDTGFDLGT